MALSMRGAKHQGEHRLAVGFAASFGADIFFHREIFAPVRRLQSRPNPAPSPARSGAIGGVV